MKTKGPKDRFTVVPWMNSEQFNKVYRCLYGGSLTDKRWAVDEIALWNTRCYPSLPTAVEATVGIVRASIHDMFYQSDKSFCRDGDIQMLYSMALIRFVNLTLEHHQKAINGIGLSVLAAKLNIPAWLIDLRNEAVHEYCPSLPMLRFAADKALQYLEETFWSKEATNIKPKTNLPSVKEAKIVDVLNQYKSLQFQRIESETLTRFLSKDLKTVLRKMSALIFRDKEKFLDILVRPGNFIAAEDVKRLITETEPFLTEDINLCLPDNIQRFWFPLLRKIHLKELMPMFLEKLLLAQEKCSNKICQKTAIAWAQQIVMGEALKSTCLLTKCFRQKGLLLNLPSLIYSCMIGATPYSTQLLNTILAKLKNKHKYNNLFALMKLYQGDFLSEDDLSSKRKKDPEEELVFTVEDAEDELKELEAKRMRSEEDVNIWSSPSVTMDFSNIPIGGVINPVIPESSQDKQSSEDSWKEKIKLGPSMDDDFIIVNKNDGEGTVKKITHDSNILSVTTIPENFDMVYRKRLKH